MNKGRMLESGYKKSHGVAVAAVALAIGALDTGALVLVLITLPVVLLLTYGASFGRPAAACWLAVVALAPWVLALVAIQAKPVATETLWPAEIRALESGARASASLCLGAAIGLFLASRTFRSLEGVTCGAGLLLAAVGFCGPVNQISQAAGHLKCQHSLFLSLGEMAFAAPSILVFVPLLFMAGWAVGQRRRIGAAVLVLMVVAGIWFSRMGAMELNANTSACHSPSSFRTTSL